MRRDTFIDRRLKRDMDRFKGNPKEEKTAASSLQTYFIAASYISYVLQ